MSIKPHKSESELRTILEQLKANFKLTFEQELDDWNIQSILRIHLSRKQEEWLDARLGDFDIPEYQQMIKLTEQPVVRATERTSPLRQAAEESAMIDAKQMQETLQAEIKKAAAKGKLK